MPDSEATGSVDAHLIRLRETPCDMSFPCTVAKWVAGTDASLCKILSERLSKGMRLLGVSCLRLRGQSNPEHIVLFRFGCAEAVTCTVATPVAVLVDIDARVVASIIDPYTIPAEDKFVEHTFSATGNLPFVLAVAPTSSENVKVLPMTWRKRRAEPVVAGMARASTATHTASSRRGVSGFETTRHSLESASVEAPQTSSFIVPRTPLRSRPTVLILSYPEEAQPLAVARQVQAMGGRAVIVDSADYPERVQLTVQIGKTSPQLKFTLTAAEDVIDESCLTGVWWWRSNRHETNDSVTSSLVKSFCQREAQMAFDGWLHLLEHRVINPLHAVARAEKKAVQLQEALAAGFVVPDTTVTNDSATALALCSQGRPTVFKAFTATTWCLLDTRRLTESQIDQFETLRHAPTIFQSEVMDKTDIRVVVVDGDLFPVSIHADASVANVDWRLDHDPTVHPHVLPDHVSARLRRLMKSLGLRFGAVDMVLRPDGEYVFLEVNTGGVFLFMEVFGESAISRRVARALLQPESATGILRTACAGDSGKTQCPTST